MGRPKAKPRHVEPENESQEIPEPEARAPKASQKASPPPAVSKAEAVRQALAAGKDSPADGTGYIKSAYGIDMEKQAFSSYKAQAKAREAKQSGGTTAKPGRKPKASPAELRPEPAPQAKSAHFSGGMIGDLAAIKALVEKLGVEEVQQIAKLFG